MGATLPSAPPPAPPEGAALSRELADFLERSGLEFEPALCTSFIRMMRQWEPQVAVVSDEHAPVAVAPDAKGEQPGV